MSHTPFVAVSAGHVVLEAGFKTKVEFETELGSVSGGKIDRDGTVQKGRPCER